MAGITLDLGTARSRGGLTGYRVTDCRDLSPGLDELGAALRRCAGPRFTAAPDALGSAVPAEPPAAWHGPEEWQEYVVTDGAGRRTATALLIAVAAATVGATVVLGLLDVAPYDDLLAGAPQAALLLALPTPYITLVALGRARRQYVLWRRPLRVRVGSRGVAYRFAGRREERLEWPELAAVQVAPRPDRGDWVRWLILWPVPGHRLSRAGSFRVDGLWGRAIVRLDALPQTGYPITEAMRQYGGPRYHQS